MSYTINGGVGQSDYGDIKWRLNQLVDDMNIMWAKISQLEQSQPVGISDLEWRVDLQDDTMNEVLKRIDDLEVARDEKIDPYDKRDAGEPANRYFVDCLKENAKLIEENDVLKYQYAAMREETARCKELLAKKNQEIDVLNHRIEFFEKMAHDLELEKNDTKWYREQAIKKCIDIVEQIKNDPLTVGDGKRWMVAICEDIQRTIKYEFGVK